MNQSLSVNIKFVGKFLALCFFILIVLSACSNDKNKKDQKSKNLSVTEIRKLEKIFPQNPAIKEKYMRSCQICHTNPEAKAPLVHDTSAWKAILAEKELDVLVQHVMTGYNAMPPKGQCGDCTEEEFRTIIKFLANID